MSESASNRRIRKDAERAYETTLRDALAAGAGYPAATRQAQASYSAMLAQRSAGNRWPWSS